MDFVSGWCEISVCFVLVCVRVGGKVLLVIFKVTHILLKVLDCGLQKYIHSINILQILVYLSFILRG